MFRMMIVQLRSLRVSTNAQRTKPETSLAISQSRAVLRPGSFQVTGSSLKETGWSTREQLFFSELVATRKQVDKLLDQQQVLIQMLAQSQGLQASASAQGSIVQPAVLNTAPRINQPSVSASATPSFSNTTTAASTRHASPATPTPTTNTHVSTASRAGVAVPSTQDTATLPTNAVTQLLDSFGAVTGSSSPTGADISQALFSVQSGDVLSGLEDVLSTPSRSSMASLASASSSQSTSSSPAISTAPSSKQSQPDVDSPVPSVKEGGLPVLNIGADDIPWMSRLHRALIAEGFNPGEDEAEDWLFGEGTQDAVMYAQAAAGLPETGVVDIPLWMWLLREDDNEVRLEIEAELGAGIDTLNTPPTTTTTTSKESTDSMAGVKYVSMADILARGAAATALRAKEAGGYPVIMEGDGNENVGALQKALGAAGYFCGDDEPKWWQCGMDTINALKTFQACAGLPETGVCDAATWQALMKETKSQASNMQEFKAFLAGVKSTYDTEDEDDSSDLTGGQQGGRVWLIGEQRWEKRG